MLLEQIHMKRVVLRPIQTHKCLFQSPDKAQDSFTTINQPSLPKCHQHDYVARWAYTIIIIAVIIVIKYNFIIIKQHYLQAMVNIVSGKPRHHDYYCNILRMFQARNPFLNAVLQEVVVAGKTHFTSSYYKQLYCQFTNDKKAHTFLINIPWWDEQLINYSTCNQPEEITQNSFWLIPFDISLSKVHLLFQL